MDDLITAVDTITGKEIGESFGTFVHEMQQELGKEEANDIVLQGLQAFAKGGYTDDPEDIQEWFNVQKDLLPQIQGLDVTHHKFYPDEPGACLTGIFGKYMIEVGIEDCRKIKDITYYTVMLENIMERDRHGELIFHSGLVFTIREIKQIIVLAMNNNTEGLIALINAKYYNNRVWTETAPCVLERQIKRAMLPLYTTKWDTCDNCICGRHRQ